MKNCPYLGLSEDSNSAAGFASDRNYCYRVKRSSAVDLDFQENFCLTEKHIECPIYLNDSAAVLPAEIRLKDDSLPFEPSPLIGWGIAAVLILAALLVGYFVFPRQIEIWGQSASAAIFPAPTPIIVPTMLPTDTPPTMTPEPSSTPSPTEIPSPIPTATLPSLKGYKLDIPILSNPQLVIHKMSAGETVPMLERKFHTNLEAIQGCNFMLPIPIWLGLVYVIPMDTVDVSSLPQFEVYKVKDPGLTLELIAQKLKGDIVLMQQYNQTLPGDELTPDTYILIPR